MRRGPLYMLIATVLFTVMVGLVKVARQDLSALEVMAWRSLTALPIAWVLARREGLVIHDRRSMLVRCLLGFGAMTCFFTAAKGLTLADLSILAKLQPIVLAILAPLVLGASERSGRVVWGVLVVGLAGCGLLIGPELAVGNAWGIWALAAAILSAGAHVMVRSLKSESPLAVVFWFQAFTVVGSVVGLFVLEGGSFPLPPTYLLPYLLGTGVAAVAGQIFLTRAYQIEKASVVAAAGYAAPLWGAIGDIVVFGTLPTGWAIVGGVLVVGAGLVLVLGKGPGRLDSGAARTHS